jgi:hypothetical protein
MGNQISAPSNFDEYILEEYKNRPLMTVEIYDNDILKVTFEAPSGFDPKKFVESQRSFGISLTIGFLINKNEQQGYEYTVNSRRYKFSYKIDNNIDHYISENLSTPPMRVTVYENYRQIREFESPRGFDLKAYAMRLPYDELQPNFNISSDHGIMKVNTNNHEYVGHYLKYPSMN